MARYPRGMPATFITAAGGERAEKMRGDGETVHSSRRGMAMSSPTVVWNHRQSLQDTLLYGSTFYILLSSPRKIKAKS